MKFVITSILCLTLVVIKCQFGESKANSQQESMHLDGKAPEEYGWNEEALEHLMTFHPLLSTDVGAARAVIAKVSQIRFGEHPLAAEWSKLFFRLYRDRKGSLVDLKRYFELENQLLSSISVEKYQKAIEESQSGIKQLDSMIALLKSQGQIPETVEGNFNFQFADEVQTEESKANSQQESMHLDGKAPEEYGWNEEALEHLMTFHPLLSTDVGAARAVIAKVSQIRFGEHPLAAEWSKLFFRLYRDRKGSLVDLKRYFELENQLLSSISVEKYQKAIEESQSGIKQLDSMIALLKSQRQTPETVEGNFNFQFADD